MCWCVLDGGEGVHLYPFDGGLGLARMQPPLNRQHAPSREDWAREAAGAGRPAGGGPIGRHLARLATAFRLNGPDPFLVAVLHEFRSVLLRRSVGLVGCPCLNPWIKPTLNQRARSSPEPDQRIGEVANRAGTEPGRPA